MYMYVRIIKCSMWLGKCVIFMSILLEIWPVKVSVMCSLHDNPKN